MKGTRKGMNSASFVNDLTFWKTIVTANKNTLGGCISGERAPPQYCSTGDLMELMRFAWLTALWSIHTMTFLLESPLKETVTGEPSASTATAKKKLLPKCKKSCNPHQCLRNANLLADCLHHEEREYSFRDK